MTDMRSPAELLRLAERYAKYLREPTAKPYLAWGRLGQIIRALHPTQAFDLACHVIRVLPGSYLQAFGGGTLAHLIHHHGPTLIDWIEREAWRDVDFLDALSHAWIARDDLDPAVLARLRIATGSLIRIVTLSERDARYRAVFEHWKTRRPHRRARYPERPTRLRPTPREDIAEHFAASHPEPPSPPTATSVAEAAPRPDKSLWWLRFFVLFARLQVGVLSRPRVVQYMMQGVLMVWLYWFLATVIAARLVLPTLVIVLAITSVSPVTDLMLVAGAFVLATVGAALAGLGIGVVNQRRALPYVGVLSVTPHLTILALIARTEHGLIVAPVVVVGLVSYPSIARFFRKSMLPRPVASSR